MSINTDGNNPIVPPPPETEVEITPIVGEDPVAGEMVAIDHEATEVCIGGYVSDPDSDTAVDVTILAREKLNARIVELAKYEDMEVAGNESFLFFVKPSPVGMAYDLIGARFDSVGGNTPVYSVKMQERK